MSIRLSVFLFFFLSACVEPLSSRGRSVGEGQSQAYPPLGISHAPSGISYTTIAEILKRPTLFDGQQIRLRGRIAGVQRRSSGNESLSTSFDLADKAGNVVKVVINARASVREGQEVMVEGSPTLLQSSASSFSDVVITDAHIVSTSSPGNTFAPARSKSSSEQVFPSRSVVPRQSQPNSGDTKDRVF